MRTPEQTAATFDLVNLPDGFHDDPYPVYEALRTHAPQKRLSNGSILLTRYDDCLQAYRDPAFSADKTREFRPKFGHSPLYDHHTTSLVFNDPPLHTRVRRLIAGALTPRAIAAMEPGLIATVDRLLDALAANPAPDLIEHFAAAIPIEIIGNLLGIPMHERTPLRDWSLAILGALEPTLTEAQLARGNQAVTDFLAYLETLVAERRRHPGDPATDVLTRLIHGEGGEALTAPELLHNCIFLLNAGHETTTNLIGNGLVTLLAHPAEKQRLIESPGLARTAIEEILRYESSNQLGNRVTSAPTTIGGTPYPAGTFVTIVIGAANRDPAHFPDPDRFDIARTPNRHLAFGTGIHQCAGMSLARLEGQVALTRFLARFPHYQLAAPPIRGNRIRFRGYTNIPASLLPLPLAGEGGVRVRQQHRP
jgi:cytochrome P450